MSNARRSQRSTGRRRLGALACTVAVVAAVAAVTGTATAATAAAAGHAAVTGAATQSTSSAPRPTRACARASAGHAACLATFRSVAGAAHAGVPASTARVAPARAAGAVAPPKRGYGPADIASIYGLDTSLGAGQTIAIVDAYNNPNAASDLAAFRSAYGLSACTTDSGCLKIVNQRGTATLPPGDAGWGVEIDLDLQAASAACPNCKLLLVEGDNESFANLGAAVNRAVTLGATIVSNSYGGDEFNGVIAMGKRYYSHPGVAMVVSSGDDGFTTASFPAVWQQSIAVGGTTVAKTADGWRQRAWEGAGSGCSAWIDKPAWQHDTHCLMRTVSDVSALADPNTGFATYDTYGLEQFGDKPGWIVVGGTSLAAPLVAGMIGLAGNAADLGSAHYLYQHRAALTDVVGGNNAEFQGCGGDYLCNGKKGYDGPTGLGTPYGVAAL